MIGFPNRDYLDMHYLAALGVLQALFRLYDAEGPLTVNELYSTGSGYRRAQLGLVAVNGLIKNQLSEFQRSSKRLSGAPAGYALAAKGRFHLNRLMAREAPDIDDRGHLLRWLTLLRNNGINSFAQLRLLVQIDETPGVCGKELFTYRSGSNNEQIDHFVEHELVSEVLVGTRKEKYPGKRWAVLRGYLNRPITYELLSGTFSLHSDSFKSRLNQT